MMRNTLAAAAAILVLASSCGLARGQRAKADLVPTAGIVLDAAGRNDRAVNQAVYEAAVSVVSSVRGRIVADENANFGGNLEIRILEVGVDGGERRELLRMLAEEKRDLVIAVGYLFSESLAAVARDYPDTSFVLIDGHVPDLDGSSNVSCVSFADQEGAFLAGAYAGMLAARAGEGSKIGFLGGLDMPVARGALAGFSSGAAWTNPGLRETGMVLSGFVGRDASAYNDPKRAEEYASIFYRTSNAILVFHTAGASGTGVFKSAARYGRLAIGSDMDQAAEYAASDDPELAALAPVIMGSVIRNVGPVVRDQCMAIMQDMPFKGGYTVLGLANGGVDFVSASMDAADKTAISGLRKLIQNGDIVVPYTDQGARAFIDGLW
ncbi:MAG: BMP family ABC transporter substrate-binding protein [Spirochaetales bacterium]|nr:BMP family ABC transporter substrate-binding protein [Spirochaetales bacterium]MBP7264469.1 BMP family ABC transporter substrate-binding protein [Spirochaetia bacterium]